MSKQHPIKKLLGEIHASRSVREHVDPTQRGARQLALGQEFTAAICPWGACAMAVEGLTSLPSVFGAKETMDRLEAGIKSAGMTVFARIDHAVGAEQVGMHLRPTEVLIFGNAKGGTPLMQAVQSSGIDLPLKALAWEDADGKTWLSFNQPEWLAKRHGLGAGTQPAVDVLAQALLALARKAAGS